MPAGAAVSFGGQYSPDILPIAERISFGGSRFGRGYQAGEVTGDSGIGAAVELNYSWPVQQKWLKQVQPYVLYEAARTRQEQRGVPSASLRCPANIRPSIRRPHPAMSSTMVKMAGM